MINVVDFDRTDRVRLRSNQDYGELKDQEVLDRYRPIGHHIVYFN